MNQDKIRNFCIIAHIDHGKSTLADRMIEATHTVTQRNMRAQLLDTMDLERERGITIKLQPVRMEYRDHILNLIDTPGHVDFTYEVSRSLAAVESAVLLVDASQGIQAQTIANLYLALEQNVAIIPVVNKIDLPNADVRQTKEDLKKLLGVSDEEILLTSGKTGVGVTEILDAVLLMGTPRGQEGSGLRALIFDSTFDEFRGVIAYVRIVDGSIKKGDRVRFAATNVDVELLDVGVFKPQLESTGQLSAGEIGYFVTGLKDVRLCRVGDTVLLAEDRSSPALPGYREVKPVVFVGIFPKDGDAYEALRDGLERLKLSDASLSFEPEHSLALGFGFRVGLLGLLHLEVMQERLRRESDLEVVVTVPSVAYRAHFKKGETRILKNPTEFPDPSLLEFIEEPWATLDIVTPTTAIGGIMQMVTEHRGEYVNTEYLDERAILHYKLPLASILVDFYDKLKSVSSGYASMNYDLAEYRRADVVRMDILVADELVESLASIVYRDEATERGRRVVSTLKESLTRQQFVVKIQAAVGGTIVAAERLSALRKDVTAKLYGGDVTRKQKLLKKQKAGKKRMAAQGKGKVDIPPEAFLSVLKK